MNSLKHFWNGKIEGIFGATSLIIPCICRKILNKLTTWIVRSNLGFAGKNVKIYIGIYYQNPSQIFFGNNVDIREKAFLVLKQRLEN